MKFMPQYTVSPSLLRDIKEVTRLITQLNSENFSDIVLMNFEREARERSSYSSTSIEGNPLPLTEVKRILKNKPENIRDTEREVLNYNNILTKLNEETREGIPLFNVDKILEVHEGVVTGLLPSGRVGRFRDGQVVVNNPRTGEIVYIAPSADEILDLVGRLVEFVNENTGLLDPLIVAGIFHKQFVLIHPFFDGNGRTARLITKLLLAKLGLNTFNLFSFENYYNNNVGKYFDMVGQRGNYYDVSENLDFTPWLEYFAAGIVDELFRVKKELEKEGVSLKRRLSSDLEKVIRYIKKNGSITDREYSGITKRAKATRVLDFNELISLGVIVRMGSGRSTYYVLK